MVNYKASLLQGSCLAADKAAIVLGVGGLSSNFVGSLIGIISFVED